MNNFRSADCKYMYVVALQELIRSQGFRNSCDLMGSHDFKSMTLRDHMTLGGHLNLGHVTTYS